MKIVPAVEMLTIQPSKHRDFLSQYSHSHSHSSAAAVEIPHWLRSSLHTSMTSIRKQDVLKYDENQK